MADTKISALANGNPAQAGDEIPIARGGANFKLSASSVAALGGGPGTIIVQEEGGAAGTRGTINFIGAGVTAADDGGSNRVNITVPGQTFGSIVSADASANVDGVAADGARSDHKHQVSTAAPTVAADAAAATAGTAATLIRSDAKLQVSVAVPGAAADAASATAGVAASLLRSDAKLQVATAVPGSAADAAAATVGTATTLLRSDAKLQVSTAVPAANSVDAAAATVGTAATLLRSDAKLQASTGTPVATGTANAAGTAATLSRSDHVHLTSFTGMVFSRGATVLTPAAAINVITWRAPYACTVTNVRGYRVGGTGATINARRNGTDNHLASALSVTSADTWMDGGSVQNTAYAVGDKMEIMLVTLAGSPTQVAVQVDFTRG